MGISDTSVAQYESGIRNPKFDTLQRIADALEVTIIQLLGESIENEVEYKTSVEKFVQIQLAGRAAGKISVQDLNKMTQIFEELAMLSAEQQEEARRFMKFLKEK